MEAKDLFKSELAQTQYEKKYRQNNETFDEFLDRITNNDSKIKELILENKFIYGGRILANRGLYKDGTKVTYSNCFVVSPPEDNLESIFDTAKKLARTFSYGGGCGIDISKLRPKGTTVHNAAKTTTGSVSFMDLYSMTTGLIGQKGRRGALMISMDISHPDIEEFIDVKTDLDKVTKANISVKITDEFIKAVKNKEKYTCKFTLDDGTLITKEIDADAIFTKLAYNNWTCAEPGILYWDRISDYNLLQHYDFEYAGVNPCAEEPLPAGGSCLLGSINLSAFIKNPFKENAYFDYDEFAKTVIIATDALNDVLIEGLPLLPLDEQKKTVSELRQIGLGMMGLADAMIKLGITYGSKESLRFIDNIGSQLLYNAIIASSKRALTEGSFKDYNAQKILDSDIIKNLENYLNSIEILNLRSCISDGLFNSQLLTTPPSGSIATLFGCSFGVEPNFAYKYTRRTLSLHDKETYYEIEADIVKQYRLKSGNLGELPEYFITTHELDPFKRVDVQAELQKFIDASISSTVNLHENTTVEQVKEIYLYGAEKGVKGLTIYRNNCNRQAILTVDNKKEKVVEQDPVERAKSKLQFGDTIMVDDSVIGIKRKLKTGCGSLHCTFYFCPETGELREVFLDKGSKGGCLSLLNAVSRLTSLCARKGAPVEEIVDQLESVLVCPSYTLSKYKDKSTSRGSSCATAIAYALESAHRDFLDQFMDGLDDEDEIEIKTKPRKQAPIEQPKKQENDMYETCPECGEKALMKVEGCVSCNNCGFSKCG